MSSIHFVAQFAHTNISLKAQFTFTVIFLGSNSEIFLYSMSLLRRTPASKLVCHISHYLSVCKNSHFQKVNASGGQIQTHISKISKFIFPYLSFLYFLFPKGECRLRSDRSSLNPSYFSGFRSPPQLLPVATSSQG